MSPSLVSTCDSYPFHQIEVPRPEKDRLRMLRGKEKASLGEPGEGVGEDAAEKGSKACLLSLAEHSRERCLRSKKGGSPLGTGCLPLGLSGGAG